MNVILQVLVVVKLISDNEVVAFWLRKRKGAVIVYGFTSFGGRRTHSDRDLRSARTRK